jgi:hypothetical protein
MTLDTKRILESKRRLRRQLAARPVTEKLAILDAMRKRAVLLCDAGQSAAVHETRGEYGTSARKASKDSTETKDSTGVE